MNESLQNVISKYRYNLYVVFSKFDKLYNETLDAIIPYQTLVFSNHHVHIEIFKLRIECLKQLSAETNSEKDLKIYEKEAIKLYISMKEQSKDLLSNIKNSEIDEHYKELISDKYYLNDFKKL